MKRTQAIKQQLMIFLFLFLASSLWSLSPTFIPRAFIGISTTVGRHHVQFVNYKGSSGVSFGFNVNMGIYVVDNPRYKGGLQFTLLEGASFEKNRRQTSENFDLPNKDFDKHIIFNFAQFRSSSVGWFSRINLSSTMQLEHQLGFGIFGTTEKDQLYDLGLSNTAGIIIGNPNQINYRIAITHDAQVGTGNPNYKMSNLGILLGGVRHF